MRRTIFIAAFALSSCHTLVMQNFNQPLDVRERVDVICRAISDEAPDAAHAPRGQPGNVRAMDDIVSRAYHAGWRVVSTGVETTGALGLNEEHLVLCFAHSQEKAKKGAKAPPAPHWPPPEFDSRAAGPAIVEPPEPPPPAKPAEIVAPPPPAPAPPPPAPTPTPAPAPAPPPAPAPAPKEQDQVKSPARTIAEPEDDDVPPPSSGTSHRKPILAPDDEDNKDDLAMPKQ